MSTAVVTRQERDTLDAILKRPAYAERFNQVLGERGPQFMSSILSIGRTMQDVDPKSLIASAMIAATLDLPIEKNLGFAWMVPYRAGGGVKMVQFQMGYKGYIQLAQRTGRYERMNARPVNKEALVGFDDVGEPKIDWDKLDETKPAVGYFFGFKLTNGFTKVCYWTKEKVEAHARKYSQAFRAGGDTPWKTEFDKMAMKTVIANELSDWGVLSVQWQHARKHDQGVVADIDAEVTYIDNSETAQIPDTVRPAATVHEQVEKAAQATNPPALGKAPAKAAEPAKETKAAPAKAAEKAPEPAKEPAAAAPAVAEKTAEQQEADELAKMGLAPEPDTNAQADAEAAAQEAAPAAGADDKFVPKEGEDEKLVNLRRVMFAEGKPEDRISEAELLKYTLSVKLSKPEQKTLGDLASSKLEQLTKAWAGLLPKIKAALGRK